MRSDCAGSARGRACNTAWGSGAFGTFCGEEQAASVTLNASNAAVRTCLEITGPNLPYHRWHIVFRRPHQGNDPSNHAPAQEEVQQEDRQQIPLAARQGNDRRQEVQRGSKAKKRKEKMRQEKHVHTSYAS